MLKWFGFGLIGLAALAAGPATAASTAELALKRVVVSSGGVAYYEHEATVEGNADLTLEVRLDQVDDVLKSLVVFDQSGGVGAIRLAGREPMAEVFRDLPFSADNLDSLAGLLQSLKGVEIEVAGPQAARGRVLSVVRESVRGEDKTETIRHRVAIAADDGVRQFVLEDAKDLRFTDPSLVAQIDGALAATAAYRVADRRTLSIGVRGTERRTVRVGYVVGAPIWKSAYRLTVTEGKATGALQGWAVLENRSGHDWKDVELVLVSGNPVTFRQALYESYYVDRPEVPVDASGHVLPAVDTGSRAAAEAAAPRPRTFSKAMEAPEFLTERMGIPDVPRMGGGGFASAPAPAADRAETLEAATQVLFRMPRPISVAAGHSLAVPIVDRPVPATRIDLFDPNTHKQHPLAAVRLVNDGDTSLPAGILTVYERAATDGAVAFVGDARIAMLPKGEERFASFALDGKTRIDQNRHDDESVIRIAVAKGVLRITSLVRATTEYRVTGPAGSAAPVIIEHPRRDGWLLVEPNPAGVSETPTAYRVTATPDKDGKATLVVVLERTTEDSVALGTVSSDHFVIMSHDGNLPEAARQAFAQAATLKRTLEDLERTAKDLRADRQAIVEDQARVRENLDAAPAGSDLQARYQKKLAAQEDGLEATDRELADLKARAEAARDALATFIAGLSF